MHLRCLEIQIGLLLWLLVALAIPSAVRAENRFFIPSTEIRGLSSNEELFIHMDNDIELTALSFSIRFDPDVVQIVSIEPAGLTVNPEWESGGSGLPQVDNTRGELIYGVATEFDFSDPPDNLMAAGTDQRVARIVLETLADTRTSTIFEFVDGLGPTVLGSRNAMVDAVGNSFGPTLSDNFITVDPLIPILVDFQDNSGPVGTLFQVTGRHFDQPVLQVTVCGNPADVSVSAGGFVMTVTAPTCNTLGPAIVEACNDFGCTSDPSGFTYEERDFRRADVDANGAANLTDAILILRYVFLAEYVVSCEDAADVNDDGSLRVDDPMRLLYFLFATALPPAAPYPLPASDPTADDLGPCL